MRLILSAACLAVMPAAASATAPAAAGTTAPALPDPVRAMVEAAAHTGDKAKIDVVVAFAKQTNRGAEAEIDRIVAEIAAIRYDNWKFVFMEQRCQGTCMIWAEPLTTLRLPKIFNLRTDPYEFADITSNSYWDWMFDHVYLIGPSQWIVGDFLETFKEFPPSQKSASFNLSGVIEKMNQAGSGGA